MKLCRTTRRIQWKPHHASVALDDPVVLAHSMRIFERCYCGKFELILSFLNGQRRSLKLLRSQQLPVTATWIFIYSYLLLLIATNCYTAKFYILSCIVELLNETGSFSLIFFKLKRSRIVQVNVMYESPN